MKTKTIELILKAEVEIRCSEELTPQRIRHAIDNVMVTPGAEAGEDSGGVSYTTVTGDANVLTFAEDLDGRAGVKALHNLDLLYVDIFEGLTIALLEDAEGCEGDPMAVEFRAVAAICESLRRRASGAY
jgi:hypothetical protein